MFFLLRIALKFFILATFAALIFVGTAYALLGIASIIGILTSALLYIVVIICTVRFLIKGMYLLDSSLKAQGYRGYLVKKKKGNTTTTTMRTKNVFVEIKETKSK